MGKEEEEKEEDEEVDKFATHSLCVSMQIFPEETMTEIECSRTEEDIVCNMKMSIPYKSRVWWKKK